MLIYNNKKEFIGIDEEDLNKLGFSNLSELMAVTADFVDMFVKEPGLVHNFNHVSWIDFVECSESIEGSKVIIDTKSRIFRCYLDVKTAYLRDEPSSKAYFINLINLREITSSEDKNKFDEVVEKPAPRMKTQPIIDIEIPEPEDKDELQTPAVEIQEVEVEIPEFENEIITDEQIQEEPKESIDLDIPLDLDFDDDLKEIPVKEEKKLEEISEETTTSLEIYDNGYVYDPKIASNELGLPVDLIEEFIEDFIAQAKEFKDELYQSFNNSDKENVKILSHKLKGVAANLRIEDAFESLAIINTSENNDEIKTNLDILYKIISKLSHEKIEVKKTAIAYQEITEDNSTESSKVSEVNELEEFSLESDLADDEDNNEYELDIFAQNDEPVKDSEVPEKIDILELSDDNFLNQDEEEAIEIDNTIDIETITNEETLSLENKLIEMDDIEPLDGIEIETNETIDIVDSGSTTYNKRNIAEEIGISYENFLELYEDYTNEAKDISNSISDAIEINNPAIWKNKATQLKAMCNNMRMDEFIKELEILIETEDTIVAKDASNSLIEAIIKISN